MPLTEPALLLFYDGCEYWPAARYPLRPRELHIPVFIREHLDANTIKQACQDVLNRTITIAFDSEDCKALAVVLLHESLFHFYKAFYNYLAARALYSGGLTHWINITYYYAKFYLARSVTTLCGRQWYSVDQRQKEFIPEIGQALQHSKRKMSDAYRMRLEVDLTARQGRIVFDTERVSSHRDIWIDYRQLSVEGIGLDSIFVGGEDKDDARLGIPSDFLVRERNEENYSFEGYWQLDFNLPTDAFIRDFGENFTKSRADVIYDLEGSDVLLPFSSQYRLYKKLNVNQLPIENDKFRHMINTCLPESVAKEHLIKLCEEGFPTKQLYSEDGDFFFDEQNRRL